MVKKIKSYKNIHQHLDLIAGLPKEDYKSFRKSFNDVYKLEPEQFQLGFLKLLKGSGLRADAKKYGLVYKDKAPYEILYTDVLSYGEMLKLKMIEEMVETYYNSNKALYSLKYMINFFESPFDFYEALSEFWQNKNYHMMQHNKMELYTILMSFGTKYIGNKLEEIKELLKFDMFLNDNVKTLPEWLTSEKDIFLYTKIKNFYNNRDNIEKYLPNLIEYDLRQIGRMSHIEQFSYDILSWIATGILEMSKNMILFDYSNKLSGGLYVNYYKI